MNLWIRITSKNNIKSCFLGVLVLHVWVFYIFIWLKATFYELKSITFQVYVDKMICACLKWGITKYRDICLLILNKTTFSSTTDQTANKWLKWQNNSHRKIQSVCFWVRMWVRTFKKARIISQEFVQSLFYLMQQEFEWIAMLCLLSAFPIFH